MNFIDIEMYGATIKKSKLPALVTCNDMIQSSRFTTESPVELGRKLKEEEEGGGGGKKKEKEKRNLLPYRLKITETQFYTLKMQV